MTPCASGDLRHLGRGEPALASAIEFGKAGKGYMMQIKIEAHANCIGRNDVINIAILEQFNLFIARFR